MIPIHHAIQPAMQVSKWQKIPMLIDSEEMRELMECLSPFWMVQASGLVQEKEMLLDPQEFFKVYEAYVHGLKAGQLVPYETLKIPFSSLWTTSLEILYRVKVNERQWLVKQKKPGVQLQVHRFHYSKVDESFRSMAIGSDAISWGIQFSYPHLYQNEDKSVEVTRDEALFPNSALFKKIQKWSREETLPATFQTRGKKVAVPIRLGKRCLSWINLHPQLSFDFLSYASVH